MADQFPTESDSHDHLRDYWLGFDFSGQSRGDHDYRTKHINDSFASDLQPECVHRQCVGNGTASAGPLLADLIDVAGVANQPPGIEQIWRCAPSQTIPSSFATSPVEVESTSNFSGDGYSISLDDSKTRHQQAKPLLVEAQSQSDIIAYEHPAENRGANQGAKLALSILREEFYENLRSMASNGDNLSPQDAWHAFYRAINTTGSWLEMLPTDGDVVLSSDDEESDEDE